MQEKLQKFRIINHEKKKGKKVYLYMHLYLNKLYFLLYGLYKKFRHIVF